MRFCFCFCFLFLFFVFILFVLLLLLQVKHAANSPGHHSEPAGTEGVHCVDHHFGHAQDSDVQRGISVEVAASNRSNTNSLTAPSMEFSPADDAVDLLLAENDPSVHDASTSFLALSSPVSELPLFKVHCYQNVFFVNAVCYMILYFILLVFLLRCLYLLCRRSPARCVKHSVSPTRMLM